MPCKVCRDLKHHNFDLAVYSLDKYRYIEPKLEHIATSAASGCQLCRVLSNVADVKNDIPNGRLYLRSTDPSAALQIGHSPWEERLELYSDRSEIIPGRRPGRCIENDALSDGCLGLASSWLNECLISHQQCRRQLMAPVLPTRIIAVGSSLNEPYLYISNGDRGRYAALSYCWGQETPLKTTRAKLTARDKTIPFSTFPKLFQDVLLVARKLGIEYVWIDSLCIVQDWPEDWVREASNMQEVYSNADFTIAADAAESPLVSLNSSLRSTVRRVHVSSPSQSNERIYLRNFGLQLDNLGLSHTHNDIRNFRHILDSRGWTFQESALSTRILHFGAYELFWECKALKRCECTTRVDIYDHNTTKSPMGYGQSVGSLNTSTPLQKMGRFWEKIVTEYTCRQLTFASDRLIAIQGLANLVKKTFPTATYMEGLWKECPALLGWMSHPNSTHTLRLQCPSWSWGSVSSPVTFDRSYLDNEESNLRIIHWAKEDGLLEVYAPICKANIHKFGHTAAQIDVLSSTELQGVSAMINLDIWVDFESDEDIECYLLPLCKLWSVHYDYCLILQKSTSGIDCYNRIGTCQLVLEDKPLQNWTEMCLLKLI